MRLLIIGASAMMLAAFKRLAEDATSWELETLGRNAVTCHLDVPAYEKPPTEPGTWVLPCPAPLPLAARLAAPCPVRRWIVWVKN